jgi:hypothetical protein
MKKQLTKPTIKHIFADGTELDHIDGIVIPINSTTMPVYNLLINYARIVVNKNVIQTA